MFFLLLLFLFFLKSHEVYGLNERDVKVLMLIIASDNNPAYLELQKIWSSYMNCDPDHFEVYFIHADPSLSSHNIDGNHLYLPGEESYKPGILMKTILALESFLPRLDEFDFIIRTNLSSFYIFPRLLNCLKTLPTTRCYGGQIMHFRPEWNRGKDYKRFVSGAGIIMSSDIARMMVEEKDVILEKSQTLADDEIMGHFVESKNIPFISIQRKDFASRLAWYQGKNAIGERDFHFRAKPHFYQRDIKENYQDEIFINAKLLKTFYPLSFNQLYQEEKYSDKKNLEDKKILLGITIKDNDKSIPTLLQCINHLKYNKEFIYLYITNCNQTDSIVSILRNWIEENNSEYAKIVYTDVSSDQKNKNYLGEIKNNFLFETKINECDYCFIVDSDSFLDSETLSYLLSKNKPIITPLLKPFPYSRAHYRNFYVDATDLGYFKDHPDYLSISYNKINGLFKIKCIRSVYLIKSDYLENLTFDDGYNDYDFLAFCRSANRFLIDQYICNEIDFGYFLHHENNLSKNEEKEIDFGLKNLDLYEYFFERTP